MWCYTANLNHYLFDNEEVKTVLGLELVRHVLEQPSQLCQQKPPINILKKHDKSSSESGGLSVFIIKNLIKKIYIYIPSEQNYKITLHFFQNDVFVYINSLARENQEFVPNIVSISIKLFLVRQNPYL